MFFILLLDDSDLDDIENEHALKKMEEFIIHPLVYPTVESIIRDIHFKTFKEFEGNYLYLLALKLQSNSLKIGNK